MKINEQGRGKKVLLALEVKNPCKRLEEKMRKICFESLTDRRERE